MVVGVGYVWLVRGVAGPETTRGELTICMLNVTYMIAMVATTVDGVISEEGVRWGEGKGVGGREVRSKPGNIICGSPRGQL